MREGGAQRPGTVLGSARGGLGSAERVIGCPVEREPFARLSLVGHEHFGGVQATHQALPRCLLVFQNDLKTLSRTELSTLEDSDAAVGLNFRMFKDDPMAMPPPLRIKADRNTAKIPKMRSALRLSWFGVGALERFFG